MYVIKRKEHSTPNEISYLSKDDQLAWLMDEYGDMVVRLAFTYVKNKELAEDISQEVFISCYNHLDEFQNRSTYKTWLYRITANKCKDVLKSWSYRNLQYKDLLQMILKSGAPTADMKMIESEEKELIFQQVLSLPLKLREVITLYYYEECTVDEIAKLLNLNTNTVKTRLHRGRNSLKTSLKGSNIYEK
ncbi:sigma-70 family RNA polymerase sigma factor [Neobacillus rhizosphaerae]|uniref:sigma-70 family RNA polymerase sigma factor n=1 Tax=Neobacillus rhizosphaerae TaxID=2880965 RepID=UPI003D2DE214